MGEGEEPDLLAERRSAGAVQPTPETAHGDDEEATAKRGSGKRALVDTGTNKRFVRRNAKGQFNESENGGRSLAADRRKKVKTKSNAATAIAAI